MMGTCKTTELPCSEGKSNMWTNYLPYIAALDSRTDLYVEYWGKRGVSLGNHVSQSPAIAVTVTQATKSLESIKSK